MNLTPSIDILSYLKSAEINAVKITKDGKRIDLGTVAFWHRNPFVLAAWNIKNLFKRNRLATAMVAGGILAASMGDPITPSSLAMATVFTNAGKAIVTNRIIGSGTEPKYIAWGTGAGTAAAADTTLFTEASETRATGTGTRVTTTVTNDTYQVTGTLTADGAKTITNAGLFDQEAVGGNLLVKGDFSGVPLGLGEGIQFTIKLVFA
jgi:hypothetical protein